MIHPTALVDPGASLADDVEVGPYAIIGDGVRLADGCKVAAGAQLIGRVEVGAGTSIGNGAIIGADPQHLTFVPETVSGVRIGKDNTIRELVTIHRSAAADGWTMVGDDNFLMAGVHLAHDVVLGDGNVIANNCLLAGHVEVGSRTFLGGGSVFHQFIRLGDLCMTQGNSAISKDVPPYCTAYRLNRLAGLNAIGLRRAGFSPALRSELKGVYRAAYASADPFREAVAKLTEKPDWQPETKCLLEALARPSPKGVCFPKSN